MVSWIDNAVFYHIYPLGYCGAPERNAPPWGRGPGNTSEALPEPVRLDEITRRLDAIAALGVNALYLGPLFGSVAHGYDTVDYRSVDRRLGTDADLARLCQEARSRGMHIVLDAVFNHVGREHPWFRDLRERGRASPYAPCFRGLDFTQRSPAGDPFTYEGWNGCQDLVRLDLSRQEVRKELIGAALSWIDRAFCSLAACR